MLLETLRLRREKILTDTSISGFVLSRTYCCKTEKHEYGTKGKRFTFFMKKKKKTRITTKYTVL